MVSIGFIVANGTAEHFPPLFFVPFALAVREPLAFGTTTGAILRCPMGVDFDGDEPLSIIFLFGVLVDFAAQLVRVATVHAPRLAAPTAFDRAQPLKEQQAPRVFHAHLSYDARGLVGRILVHAPDVCPQLLIAVFPCDWFA